MNDRIMNTWDVVNSDLGGVMFRCARKETAEYLRDWCEAEEYNRYLNACLTLNSLVDQSMVKRMASYLDVYHVVEGEVIL
ncbi:hypothetical protein D3C81_1639520 [compost metagenome]